MKVLIVCILTGNQTYMWISLPVLAIIAEHELEVVDVGGEDPEAGDVQRPIKLQPHFLLLVLVCRHPAKTVHLKYRDRNLLNHNNSEHRPFKLICTYEGSSPQSQQQSVAYL